LTFDKVTCSLERTGHYSDAILRGNNAS